MQPLSDHFTNVPAFLTKLWKMVSDSKTDHLICWSPNGNSFIISNQVQFWYELLPLYYKHNNMSSFVRQLNMYGFHKVSSVENGPIADGEKDEVQFFHPYFQKENPELLKMIKRKVTVSKHSSDNSNQVVKNEDLSKVLLDVKHLRGRQASVDSQLAAMKQENAVLWRELAVLRQKHTKQQQIVNKLIQFLVSMVHPGGNRMGVGVKRHYPLMLRGTPSKRTKKTAKAKSDGPTIHELDNEIEVEPEELLTVSDNEERDLPLIYRPLSPSSSTPSLGVLSPLSNIDLTNELINEADNSADNSNPKESSSPKNTKEGYWDKSPYVFPDNGEDGPSNELLSDAEITVDPILNILEDNIIKNSKSEGNEDQAQSSGAKSSNEVGKPDGNTVVNNDMIVATIKAEGTGKMNSGGDLGSILETNQSEIDLYKDLLHGCGTFDTNTLLGEINRMPFYQPDYALFNEGSSEYGLSFSQDEVNQNSGDPMVSGQEVATYPMLPLEQLLDDSLNSDLVDEIIDDDLTGQLNTPQISDTKPTFPTD